MRAQCLSVMLEYAKAVAALRLTAGTWLSLPAAPGLRKYDRQPSSEALDACSASIDGPI